MSRQPGCNHDVCAAGRALRTTPQFIWVGRARGAGNIRKWRGGNVCVRRTGEVGAWPRVRDAPEPNGTDETTRDPSPRRLRPVPDKRDATTAKPAQPRTTPRPPRRSWPPPDRAGDGRGRDAEPTLTSQKDSREPIVKQICLSGAGSRLACFRCGSPEGRCRSTAPRLVISCGSIAVKPVLRMPTTSADTLR